MRYVNIDRRRVRSVFVFSIFLMGMAGPAFADCRLDGTSYPTGTRIGPLVCQPDGSWRP